MSSAGYIASDVISQDLLIEMTEALMNVKFCGLLIVVSILLGIFNVLLCIFVLYSVKETQNERSKAYKFERRMENESIHRKIADLEKTHKREIKVLENMSQEVKNEWMKKLEMIEKEIESIKNEKLENLSKTFSSENEKRAKEISTFKTEFDHRLKQESASVERRVLRFELYVSKMKEFAGRHRNNSMASYLDELRAMTLEN